MISKFLNKCAPNIPVFQEGFGMTESSPVTHMQPIDDGFLGGCGHPVPNTIAKVVDLETGNLLTWNLLLGLTLNGSEFAQ